MLKGLALTPPVIGRISIGRVVEKNGKRLPEKDDEFTITSQVQLKDGWVLHPVDEVLRKDTNAKLRSIPVRLLFGDPDLSLRVKYTLFERTTGRPLCVGDGESCRRVTPSGMQSLGAMFFLWITGVFKWRTVHAYFAIWSAPREGGSLLQ